MWCCVGEWNKSKIYLNQNWTVKYFMRIMFGAECFSYNKSLGEIFGARSIDNIFALANGIAKHLVCKCCMKMVWQNPKSRNAWTKTDLFLLFCHCEILKRKKNTVFDCLVDNWTIFTLFTFWRNEKKKHWKILLATHDLIKKFIALFCV